MSSGKEETHLSQIRIYLNWPGSAEGWYAVKAKGAMLSVLHWGDAHGAFEDWSPFAYVPIDPAGNGEFYFSGNRGIPGGVTHVWAKVYTEDFSSFEWSNACIPEQFLTVDEKRGNVRSFSILTDFHMSQKPWRVRQALRAAESDVVFLLGDSSNDGRAEQFENVLACISDVAPDKAIFPVIGNHDVLHPSAQAENGCVHYEDFQKKLLSNAESRGFSVQHAPDGRAYSVTAGDIDIVALHCVTTGRMFVFPEDIEIDWLNRHLLETPALWHIVLCHAPLIRHNPNRNDGPAYFSKNNLIQEIIDQTGRVIFLNGHTHVSPNVLIGNGEYDRARGNIYLDCASVVETDTSREKGMMARDWKDGCETELTISENTVEITMRSIATGAKFSRGYYRFSV